MAVQWTTRDVASWLECRLCLPYGQSFSQACIDGPALLQLDADRLGEVGVVDPGHMHLLLKQIAVLRTSSAASCGGCRASPRDQRPQSPREGTPSRSFNRRLSRRLKGSSSASLTENVLCRRAHSMPSLCGFSSEFGCDVSRGAFFTSDSKFDSVSASPVSPGPARYALSKSTLETKGVGRFGVAIRRTDEWAMQLGASSPGSKYNPQVRGRIRGGSIPKSAPSEGARSYGKRGLPRLLPETSPGPQQYFPRHHSLSGFR